MVDKDTVRTFPTSEPMKSVVAHLVAGDAFDKYGLGVGEPHSPLFPISVQLTGNDGNAYSIMGAVERAVKKWTRVNLAEAREPWHNDLLKAVLPELQDSQSYAELLAKAQCLVEVY